MKRAVIALYRVRGVLFVVAAVILVANAVFGRFDWASRIPFRDWLVWAGVGLIVMSVLLTYGAARFLPQRSPIRVHAPVAGRWQALNSPVTAVPSHGVRAYGQAYAIDLVHDPVGHVRPEFGQKMMRASAEYPAFGQPVLAMIDGTVVRTSDWRRDHRARSNGWGIMYLMLEGMLREIGGPGFVVGNHVVIRGDDGVYAAVVHLQQGSATVAVGDRVQAGSQVGLCGNSGNSSEPHVHAQLMDRASFLIAQGVPMTFTNITMGEAQNPAESLPANGEHLVA